MLRADMPGWLKDFLPIVALLALVVVVVGRLPKVDLGHDKAFLRRRFMNWFPVGLTYAFLYMGRYNLNACIGHVFDKAQFSDIYFWGTLTYGFSFVINGPLTDRLGGKKTIILAALGAIAANVGIGLLVQHAMVGGEVPKDARAGLVPTLSVLYALNMYFQSFGAVSIVKVNSAWFHLRERGTFGGIFGILISLGLYFAYDWCAFILKTSGPAAVFFVPSAILAVFAVLDLILVRDTPGEAGLKDFDLGDASSGDDGPRKPIGEVVTMMLKNPAIITIALIEFCSGYLRNSILQYYKPFAKETGRVATEAAQKAAALAGNVAPSDFVHDHWGMLNCMAGIAGGVVAGIISDRVFGSRRGPVAGVLYLTMIVGAGLMFVALPTAGIGWVVVLMSLAIIGVHGMLSGTASMDFGGKKNVGIVVGVIDGFVYLGTAAEALVLGRVLPKDQLAHDAHNWWTWPAVMLPAAILGFGLSTRVWNARPKAAAPASSQQEPQKQAA
ncbi:Glycerol-3-phosphate transporter [Labilithrix luteola]|uniref:Glycerol-3-phosphate transporter n=1 Tax=Labilithrix luteola TaxID=1391654 RepID=A0A0K1Q511_9BACT|nr:MFS transporter [Labilithrix luteola]AKV00926.1 Glycerol-3-phosphate transporter [Labilithrix luteola]